MDDITFARLTSHLTKVLGLDLTAYKQQQMRRRVGTFLGKHNIANADELIRRLEADKDLLQALRDMLTINVTEFFRDGAQWELLEKQVMPHLLANKSSLKIWSAGCSRGQEPISLAITLDRLGALRGSRILGTDFDHASLAKARAGGPYASFEMGGITPDDRGRYFTMTGAHVEGTGRLAPPAPYQPPTLAIPTLAVDTTEAYTPSFTDIVSFVLENYG